MYIGTFPRTLVQKDGLKLKRKIALTKTATTKMGGEETKDNETSAEGREIIMYALTAPALLARYRSVPAISSSPPNRRAGMKSGSEGCSVDGSRADTCPSVISDGNTSCLSRQSVIF